MARRRRYELGTMRARCASCGAQADLTLSETRLERNLLNLVRRRLDRRVDRQVTCSQCRRTYPTRARDVKEL